MYRLQRVLGRHGKILSSTRWGHAYWSRRVSWAHQATAETLVLSGRLTCGSQYTPVPHEGESVCPHRESNPQPLIARLVCLKQWATPPPRCVRTCALHDVKPSNDDSNDEVHLTFFALCIAHRGLGCKPGRDPAANVHRLALTKKKTNCPHPSILV